MHGMNKSQINSFIPLLTNTLSSGEQVAELAEFYLDSPSVLQTLGITVQSDNAEFYMYRNVMTLHLKSYGWSPVWVQCIKLYSREDISYNQTVLGIMGADAPPVNYPFFSCTTSNVFQKQFKILSNKVYRLQPDAILKLRLSRKYRSIPWTGEYQGNTINWKLTRGNLAMVIKVYGDILYAPNGPGGSNSQQLSSFTVGGILQRYASWYYMNDATPDSTNRGTIPLLTQTSQRAGFYGQRVKCYDSTIAVPSGTEDPDSVIGAFPVNNIEDT